MTDSLRAFAAHLGRAGAAASVGALLAFAPMQAQAAGAIGLLDAGVDVGDRASLQRGAGLYVNYCLGCHSLEYMRYKRLAEDLGIDLDTATEKLVDGERVIVDEMRIAMPGDVAKEWFGVAPPDLSVRARSRGTDWIYSYLMTYYRDDNPARPFGVNNVVYEGTAMPHVLWPLQGTPEYVEGEIPDGTQNVHTVGLAMGPDGVRVLKEGEGADGEHVAIEDVLKMPADAPMSIGEYQRQSRDLAAFLTYVGEPAVLHRAGVGMWVLGFLLILIVLSRMLYKEYWKDVA